MNARPPIGAFVGRWSVDRRIRHAPSGLTARFEGTLEIAPAALGYLSLERGALHIPGRPAMPAERRHIWRAEGPDIAVAFADGRAFHRIGPGARAHLRHDCPPDLYTGLCDVTRWPHWRVFWRASGPRKDQRILSHMRPAA